MEPPEHLRVGEMTRGFRWYIRHSDDLARFRLPLHFGTREQAGTGAVNDTKTV